MALAIIASGLAFGHSDAAPLFSSVDFRVEAGFHGVVGANGAGKTTLLRIVRGELAPDRGSVRIEPAGAVVTLCAQEVDACSDAIARFAEREDRGARRVRGDLDLDASTLDRWATLSPGERKRWQIGAAIAEEPEVLLLDEPTNHVDADARETLLAALARFRGVALLVSHDRALLEALTVSTLRVHRLGVEHRPGSYDDARGEWEREGREAERARANAKGAERAAERKLAEARAHRESIERRSSSGARMKNVRDHDARGGLTKGRIAGAEASISRAVGARNAALARAREALSDARTDKELGGPIAALYEPCPRPRVLAIDRERIVAGERVLLEDVHLAVRPRDRVALLGPNGAGKSTLLEALTEGSNVPRDRLFHLRQELAPAEARAILDEVRAMPPETRGRTLAIAAALGIDIDRVLASRRPSPGEARKLAMARALGMRVWALVLDEPTNHLDLPSIDRVERALAVFPGALLIATHDPRLVDLASTRWILEEHRVRVASAQLSQVLS